MRLTRIFAAAALLCCLFFSAQAESIPENYKAKTRVTTGTFGTSSILCIYDDFTREDALAKYDRVWDEIKRIIESLDVRLSVSIKTSEIAQFNALPEGGRMPISPETAEVFLLAQDMYQKTNGYFDPTVYPLVDLWGFSPRFRFEEGDPMPYDRQWENDAFALPEKKYIDGLLKLVGFDGIALEGDAAQGYTLVKNTPSVTIDGEIYQAQIDLGGIAKGYAADRVAELLEREGYLYGYFSCGSSSMRLLKSGSSKSRTSGDPSFSLQVRNPRKTEDSGDAYAMIRVKDQSLSSSGDYDSNYTAGGSVCCHIISPKDGYPLNFAHAGVQGGVSTVTLLSGSAVEDDALTTALCLMGPAQAIDFINKNLRGHSVALVLYRADSDLYEVVTNIPESHLEIVDSRFQRASDVDASGNLFYTGSLFIDSL